MKPKIAHVIFNLSSVGGAETLLLDIANAQAAEGCEVTVIIINRENDPSLLAQFDPKVAIKLINRPTGSKNPWYAIKLSALVARLRPAIIHLHGERAIGLIASNFGAKTCLTLHTTGLNLIQPSRIDAICSISDGVKEDLLRRQNLSSTVVYNGVRTSDISLKTDGRSNPIRILQVGRLDHQIKGQHLLIEALATLTRKGIGATATFMGGGKSLEYLKEKAAAEGVADKVDFMGAMSRSEIYAQIRDYDIVAQPSIVEGFGLTIAEAMSAGVPVAVADIAGPMEIVAGGQLGEVFRQGDSQSLAEALLRIANDYEGHLALAQGRALTEVKRRFDISATVAAYGAIYEKLLQR